MASSDVMKPHIPCKVFERGVNRERSDTDNIIGHFEIDLGYFSYITKLSLKYKLINLYNYLLDKFGKKSKKPELATVERMIAYLDKEMSLKPSDFKEIADEKNMNFSKMGAHEELVKKKKEYQGKKNFEEQETSLQGSLMDDYDKNIEKKANNKAKEILKDEGLHFKRRRTMKKKVPSSLDLRKHIASKAGVQLIANNMLQQTGQVGVTRKNPGGFDNNFNFNPKSTTKLPGGQGVDIMTLISTQRALDVKKMHALNNGKKGHPPLVILPQYENIVKKPKKRKSFFAKTEQLYKKLSQDMDEDEKDEEEKQALKIPKRTVLSNAKEINKPNLEMYRAIGYDTASKRSKHYRLQLNNSLEKSGLLGKSEFDSIQIYKGKRIDTEKNWFLRLFTGDDKFRNVGMFRGGVKCISHTLLRRLNAMKMPKELKKFDIPYDQQSWEIQEIDADMLTKNFMMIRIYILDAKIFENTDIDSFSDPFIQVMIGDKKVDTSENAIVDKLEPIFNKFFE